MQQFVKLATTCSFSQQEVDAKKCSHFTHPKDFEVCFTECREVWVGPPSMQLKAVVAFFSPAKRVLILHKIWAVSQADTIKYSMQPREKRF